VNDKVAKQVTKFVALAAALLAVFATLFGGFTVGMGAAVGGLVATLDALVLVKLATRITGGKVRGQGLAAALLGAKLALLGAICWALLARWGVDPLGFGVGFSAMVLGVLYAAVELSADERAAENG